MVPKKEHIIPSAFVWRRIHSLLGLWLVIYLFEHLLTNSQAALWLGNDGKGFIRIVNVIHALPFLQVIELTLIGVPILVHGYFGVKYALTSRGNAKKTDGSKPSMRLGRSYAYTLQRLSSWILLVGIILHVVQMRFLDKPKKAMIDNRDEYFVKLKFDEGLYTLAPRLDVQLYGPEELSQFAVTLRRLSRGWQNGTMSQSEIFQKSAQKREEQKQDARERIYWLSTITSYEVHSRDVIAACRDPATAILLHVRDTFKSPFMDFLYTIFVLAASFHAANGLWTFLISWGAILSYRSQKKMINVSVALMLFFLFLGLASIWGSYWLNLRY
jgi:succinate dehydrogenase / fumarate reductase, cytochrome b subunit